MKRHTLMIVLLAILMIPTGLTVLLNSNNGSRWLLQQLVQIPAAPISIADIEGRLLGRMHLTQVSYRSGGVALTINDLIFAWQPVALLWGRLKIADLTAGGLNLTISGSGEQQKSGFDFDEGFELPVQLTVDNLLLTDASLQQNGRTHLLKKLQFSAATAKEMAEIRSLTVETPGIEAAAHGQIGLGKGFSVNLSATWKAGSESDGNWQGAATIKGDAHRLGFNHQLNAPFKMALQGYIADVLTAPDISAQGNWQNISWPFAGGQPQIRSRQGAFTITGSLNDYHITADASLSRQGLPGARLLFDTSGSPDALAIKNLELTSPAGLVRLAGAVAWRGAPEFDLNAGGQNFNPAILLPEVPGNLNFSTRLQGKWAHENLQFAADLKHVSGRLRGYPVSAIGKLALQDDRLQADGLQIIFGANKLSAGGTLAQHQGALDLVLTMPVLEQLWPALGGSLQGQGQLRGAWRNPAVQFIANGKHLHVAGNRLEQLFVDVDYHPGAQRNSTLKLTANAITSGAIRLSNLALAGRGNRAQHSFTAALRSDQGSLSAVLAGSLNNNNWRGAFSKIDISLKQAGLWQLDTPLLIDAAQTRHGFEITAEEACLKKQSAALCAHGRYSPGGDFQFALESTAVPLALAQAWLPEYVQSNAVINGAAQIDQQKNRLSGTYRLAIPASALSLKNRECALGASSLSGAIKDHKMSGYVALGLCGRDYAQGRLQIDIGKSANISGKMTAKIDEFTPVKAFVPKLIQFEGHLLADLTVNGTIRKPAINGRIDFTGGLADTETFSVHDINIHALAIDGDRIRLHGAAAPQLFRTGGMEPLKIKGAVTFDADLQQQKNGLRGHYRLATPAKASITVNNSETVFGISSLSGDVNGDILTADLDLGLFDRDYLRASLRADTGKSLIRSGRLNASITDFALVEIFVPQLASVKGQLTADLNLSGALQQPQITGTAKLNKGSADLPGLGISMKDIDLQALASADDPVGISITGAAQSGEGAIKADGVIVLPGHSGMAADIMLSGQNFEIAKLPEAQIAVSPALKIAYADGKGKIGGILKVPKALLTLPDIPENAVKVSGDEIILGRSTAKQEQQAAIGIDADIEVELGKQAAFTGMGLKTGLAGRLKLINTANKLTTFGNVDLVKAGYKRFGQELSVRKGRFLFNGPSDNPWVEVEAIRLSKNKKVTAVLSLSGPLKNPKTRIFSEPELPETEALAYLITGSPFSQLSKSDSQQVASAALSYGAGQLSWLTGKLGIDEFAVEEGETLHDSLLAAGRYLTPDFYVGTKVGLFNKQTLLILKHKLTDKINVETQTGSSQRIKLNYEFDRD